MTPMRILSKTGITAVLLVCALFILGLLIIFAMSSHPLPHTNVQTYNQITVSPSQTNTPTVTITQITSHSLQQLSTDLNSDNIDSLGYGLSANDAALGSF